MVLLDTPTPPFVGLESFDSRELLMDGPFSCPAVTPLRLGIKLEETQIVELSFLSVWLDQSRPSLTSFRFFDFIFIFLFPLRNRRGVDDWV
jgi:hypothetical protein